jgi:hypothetical protein
VKSRKGLHSGRLTALPVNVRLGLKSMAVPNNLAYYDTAAITAVRKVYSTGTRVLDFKTSQLCNLREIERFHSNMGPVL